MPIKVKDRLPQITIAGILLITMIVLSGTTGIKEIIFPEAFALACGLIIRPSIPWNAPRHVIILMMVGASVAGILLNTIIPGPLYWRVLIGFALVMITFAISGYSMPPMISAVILPVMLGTTSILYPICVTVIITLFCFVNYLLEKKSLSQSSSPVKERKNLTRYLFATMAVAAFCCFTCFSGLVFLSAPPLIVLFTELTENSCPANKHPVTTVISVIAAAVTGTLARYLMTTLDNFSLPSQLILATLAIMVYFFVMVIWHVSRLWLPPVGAVACLALLVPTKQPWMYAAEVAVGIVLWSVIAYIVRKLLMRKIRNINRERQQNVL